MPSEYRITVQSADKNSLDVVVPWEEFETEYRAIEKGRQLSIQYGRPTKVWQKARGLGAKLKAVHGE